MYVIWFIAAIFQINVCQLILFIKASITYMYVCTTKLITTVSRFVFDQQSSISKISCVANFGRTRLYNRWFLQSQIQGNFHVRYILRKNFCKLKCSQKILMCTHPQRSTSASRWLTCVTLSNFPSLCESSITLQLHEHSRWFWRTINDQCMFRVWKPVLWLKIPVESHHHSDAITVRCNLEHVTYIYSTCILTVISIFH